MSERVEVSSCKESNKVKISNGVKYLAKIKVCVII